MKITRRDLLERTGSGALAAALGTALPAPVRAAIDMQVRPERDGIDLRDLHRFGVIRWAC